MKDSLENVVIVGYGWVGQANGIALARLGYPVSYFDPNPPKHHYVDTYGGDYERIKRLEKVDSQDSENTWYIVCVGDRVSEEGVQDISFIKNALNSLKGLEGSVILRSTVLPESLKLLDFDYYVPEFLHEKKAVEECLEPFFFVTGKRDDAAKAPSFFTVWSEKAAKVFSGTPEEASYIKYLSNLWNSVRIAFVNEFGDAIREPKSKEDIDTINGVVDFIFGGRQYLRYGRSFGGHCLPKDTRAFARMLRDSGRNSALLDGTYESNRIHEATQGKYPHLPEWFSVWLPSEKSGREAFKDLSRAVVRNLKRPGAFISKVTKNEKR